MGTMNNIKHAYGILSFLVAAASNRPFGQKKPLTFSGIGYISDGASMVVTDCDDRYILTLRPIGKNKPRPIPLTFNSFPTESDNETGI